MKRALATAALLLAAGCGGGDASRSDAAPEAGPTATATASATAGASAPPSATPTPAAGSAAPGGSGGAASTAPAGRPPTTPRALPSSAGRAAPDRATPAGEYVYDTSGTVTAAGSPQRVDTAARLLVDPAAGDRQHSALEGESSRTEQDLRLRQTGRYLERLIITNPAFSKTFEPGSALLLPEPARVGARWSWSATSTDGKTTVSQRSRVDRTETVTLDGKRVRVVVVVTSLTLRGDLTYDGTTTTWVSEQHRLSTRVDEEGRGTVGGLPFSSDTTSVLRSAEPA